MNGDGEEITIFGGTFDPIHMGHLIIAEQTREQFGLSSVLFIPAGDPPHKTRKNLSPADTRYDMTELAIDSNERFEITSLEIDREGPSFTAQTIAEFIHTGKRVSVIMGADSLAEIFLWRDPEYILKNSRLLVAQRPGYDIEVIKNHPLYCKYNTDIRKIETGYLDISSSRIRKRVKEKRTIKYLVPEKVRELILKERLYQDDVR